MALANGYADIETAEVIHKTIDKVINRGSQLLIDRSRINHFHTSVQIKF